MLHRRRPLVLALALAALLLAPVTAAQALSAGALDPGFRNGQGGLVTTGTGIARGADTGRYYVGGTADYEPVDGYIDSTFSRLLPNGDLEHNNWNNTEAPETCGRQIDENTVSIRHCGFNSLQFQQHTGTSDVVLQPSGLTDGRLVGAGHANFHGGYLYRMTEAGYKDTSFGTNGVAEAPDEACGGFRSVTVQADRKLVAAAGCGGNARVLRFTRGGKRDLTFSAQAENDIYPEGSGCCEATHEVLQLRGGPLLALVSGPPALIALEADGTRRTGWASGGRLELPSLNPAHNYDYADYSLIALRSGAFLASRGPFLVRITSDGRIDREFGDNGTAKINVAPEGEGIFQITEQADGRIIAVGGFGGPGYGPERGAFVARLTQDGQRDTTFGDAGARLRRGNDGGGNPYTWNDLTLDPPAADTPSGKLTVTGHGGVSRYILGSAAVRNSLLPSFTPSSTVKDGMLLTADKGNWEKIDPNGSDTVQYRYQWLRCDADGGACTPITGAGVRTYEATARDVGKRLRVRVTALVDNALNAATSRPGPVVDPVLPHNTALPTIAAPDGRAGTTATMTSGGTWGGTVPQRPSYQWVRCTTVELSSCTPIFRATGTAYRLTDRDAGRHIRLRVTRTNVGGSTSAHSAHTPKVKAASPFLARPTFDAFSEFRFSPEGPRNPDGDIYGNADVWSYAFGNHDTLADESTHTTYGGWGTGFYVDGDNQFWYTNLGYGYSTPFLGTSPGAGSTGLYIHPGHGHAGLVRWRNAGADGSVRIAGSVRDANAGCGDGVRYVLLQGSRVLLDGTIANGGRRSFPSGRTEAALLANVAVPAGERVSLAIASPGSDACDGTWVDLKVTQREPEVVIDAPAQDETVARNTATITGRSSVVSGDSSIVNVTIRNAAGRRVASLSDDTLTAPGSTTPGRWSVTTPALREGTYTAVATQAASGHVGKTLPRTFVIDLP